MKVIFVLDKIPENCMQCPLRFKDGNKDDWFMFRCILSTDQIPKEGRLWNCELKFLPLKKTPSGSDIFNDYVRGYNDCIDDILGEKE